MINVSIARIIEWLKKIVVIVKQNKADIEGLKSAGGGGGLQWKDITNSYVGHPPAKKTVCRITSEGYSYLGTMDGWVDNIGFVKIAGSYYLAFRKWTPSHDYVTIESVKLDGTVLTPQSHERIIKFEILE